jgi:leucyl-tRNA synthetase
MPGWAGSSQYFNRYMDPLNENEIFSQEAINYWQQVDLYIGGSEHATGHLLYSRFWQKFMFDKGLVPVDEYAKKLINQGMILGTSAFVYYTFYSLIEKKDNGGNVIIDRKRIVIPKDLYFQTLSTGNDEVLKSIVRFDIDSRLIERLDNDELILITPLDKLAQTHVPVEYVNSSDELDVDSFRNWHSDFKNVRFISEGKPYKVGREPEKMSKSKYNVVNPDQICHDYGADSLRLYEMFLGPLEQYKPWNTAGITGVHGFLKKLWRLYFDDNGFKVTDSEPSQDNLKTLHKTIKKVEEDIENFSFNTSVSTFMIAVN